MSTMSTTPSHRSSRSGASSASHSRASLPVSHARPPSSHSYSHPRNDSVDHHDASPHDEPPVPIETLVEHLLAAKRSLSSMTLMLRAQEIARLARGSHEEAVVLAAEAEYLRRGIVGQLGVLKQVRRGLNRTYDAGKKDFKMLIRMMDSANGKLQRTMGMLRETIVERSFRKSSGGDDEGMMEGSGAEGDKNLMDFVDEKGVKGMVEELKKSLNELQATQTSFDGDILRFETEIRNLRKAIAASSIMPPSPSVSRQPIGILLYSLADHSHNMADLLSSLTKHFDLCVTAVRTTEGGAALARRKAAEVTQSQDGSSVSISGVIAEQESHVSDLEPITWQDRADMIKIVMDDASEVEGVVHEMNERLAAMETEFESLEHQTAMIRAAHQSALGAFRALEDVGSKMPSYVAAETEFLVRWTEEKHAILAKLEEMDQLREFYEGYAQAYDRLLVEVDRRRLVEERVRGIWKKASESVDRLIDEDKQNREMFMQDAGEFLPTDLWSGMRSGMKRWEVRPAAGAEGTIERSTPTLSKNTIEAAKERLSRGAR